MDNLKGSRELAPRLLLVSIVLAISCWISTIMIELPSRRMVRSQFDFVKKTQLNSHCLGESSIRALGSGHRSLSSVRIQLHLCVQVRVSVPFLYIGTIFKAVLS